ncbi:MAG: hypothetical protein KKB39_02085, partial [Nanoarchaeota archaeon]|nr:hypothetical protein [Nanoarchaeota archaeon]
IYFFIMNKRRVSKFFIIMFVMILISSTLVAAGFWDWFFGNGLDSVTGKVTFPEGAACDIDSQCTTDYCKPFNADTGICSACNLDLNCDDGKQCWNGECVKRPCNLDSDCLAYSGPTVCNEMANECEFKGQTLIDGSCSVNRNCISGLCLNALCSCNGDNDCNDGKICNFINRCVNSSAPVNNNQMQPAGIAGVVNQQQSIDDLEQVYEERVINFGDNQEQPSVEASTELELELLVEELNTLISSMETALNDNSKKLSGTVCANDIECVTNNCIGIFWKRCA